MKHLDMRKVSSMDSFIMDKKARPLYKKYIKEWLEENDVDYWDVKESNFEQDTKESTDIVVVGEKLQLRFSCRVRKYIALRYKNQFTITSNNPSGAKCEKDKLYQTNVDYNFYAFFDINKKDFTYYKIYDWNKVKNKLAENLIAPIHKDISSKSGCVFEAYDDDDFEETIIKKGGTNI